MVRKSSGTVATGWWPSFMVSRVGINRAHRRRQKLLTSFRMRAAWQLWETPRAPYSSHKTKWTRWSSPHLSSVLSLLLSTKVSWSTSSNAGCMRTRSRCKVGAVCAGTVSAAVWADAHHCLLLKPKQLWSSAAAIWGKEIESCVHQGDDSSELSAVLSQHSSARLLKNSNKVGQCIILGNSIKMKPKTDYTVKKKKKKIRTRSIAVAIKEFRLHLFI